MQIRALLDLEQFPDSPYANELRRDFPDLRFSPALEKDFQTFQLDRVRARVRFFQLATFLLCVAVAAHLVVLDRLSIPKVLVGWLGVAIVTSAFLVCASWSRFYERLYLPAARI